MVKTVLLGLFTMLMVGTLTTAGLFGYFNDTETSAPNLFVAGSINILLTGNLGPGENGQVHGSAAQDYKPGQTGYLVFYVTNSGGFPASVWKLIDSVNCIDAEHPDAEDTELINDAIDEVTRFSLWIDRDGDPEVYTEGVDRLIISQDAGLHVSDIEGYYIYLCDLTQGESIVVVQSYRMEPDTTNWAQGDVMTFNEHFTGQQVQNPLPPGPELPGYGKP